MYAIFKAQGKQFRAVEDAVLRIPSLEAEPGDTVKFDDVLLAEQDGDVHVGAPCVAGASVAAEVVSHGRGDKIIVYKMKRRKGYRRKQGHRQGYTEIRIVGIDLPDEPREAAAKPAAAAPKAEAAPKAGAAPAPEAAPEAEAAPAAESSPVDITPMARELAEEHGLDLGAIEGTGKDGRILKGDVDRAIAAKEGD
ncbi:50S ribosomal protein L21 [Candidatus Palauibacter sp.]|uniref:50S ribosomal protein L21 n=1 Tax=Candidatus Palauibacter sp. TaxID=3101350 RepID=UPI003B02E020